MLQSPTVRPSRRAPMARKGARYLADVTNERVKQAGGHFEHGGRLIVGSARDRRDRTVTILSPFEVAHARGTFTDGQYHAGERFYAHWSLGGMLGCLASIDLQCATFGNGGNGHLAATEAQVTHRQHYHEAEKLLGLETTMLVRWIICEGETFETAGHRLGWRDRRQASAAATER